MSIISFWSPEHGRGNTSNSAAVGAMIGLDYDIRTLIARTQFGDSSLEGAFLKSKELQLRNFAASTASGMDALERLFKTKRLEAASISNHTLSLEPGRLDLLTGTSKSYESAYEGIEHVIAAIFEEAKRYYQAIILDIEGGSTNAVSNQLLKSSDLVVVNLSQDIMSLERYISKEQWPSGLQETNRMILLGQYDPHSKYNMTNIRRKFGIKDPVFALPYCSEYRDAFNDRDVLGWFRRSRNAGRRHGSYPFFQEVRKTAKEILAQIGVNTEIKHIERGVS
ncbi:hypothetical protein OIN60_00540 [Paenibacillus sp. P96]|uniref:Uncharacterized protein n=1 Tax=Paenibacillus zeirhizosphaerae TaxID=2987519 RepID=A0ABT9FKM5_9BACL|nr:hypothetical protein [Paenibacillus sp. P96]MDP4095279.1 hypothetical protein [Paenibacillus sp. P96]